MSGHITQANGRTVQKVSGHTKPFTGETEVLRTHMIIVYQLIIAYTFTQCMPARVGFHKLVKYTAV